jgi:hypothetical protein
MRTPRFLHHGCSALSIEAIQREGIKEACPGRGVGLMHPDDSAVSRYNAWRAEWRSRYQHGSAETVGLGAVVTVDTSKLDGLVFAPCGILRCPHDAWYAGHVPNAAIVGIDTFTLALPEVNSPVDVAMCAQGVGTDRSASSATPPTMRIVQERLAADDPCDRVSLDEYAESVELARLRVASWDGLSTPSLRALRLARQHAAQTASPTDPLRDLTNAVRMRRFAKRLREPGNAALAIDGEFMGDMQPARVSKCRRDLAARDLLRSA